MFHPPTGHNFGLFCLFFSVFLFVLEFCQILLIKLTSLDSCQMKFIYWRVYLNENRKIGNTSLAEKILWRVAVNTSTINPRSTDYDEKLTYDMLAYANSQSWILTNWRIKKLKHNMIPCGVYEVWLNTGMIPAPFGITLQKYY